MAFENGGGSEDWRSVIVPLYKGKGERTECKNYRGIILFNVVGKIHVEILVDRILRVTGGLIDDEQGDFRVGRVFVDQTFTLKQRESMREKMQCVCVLYIWRRHMIGKLCGKC